MKRKTSNSPYPVLYPAGEEYAVEQGYRAAHFDVKGDPRVTVNEAHNLEIDFSFDLTDPTLLDLVEKGVAQYYVNVECGHTYYRHPFVQTETDFHLEIPYGEIADSIEIFVGLVSMEKREGFSAPGFAERFGAAKFDLEKGDILAVATGWTVELEPLDDVAEPYIQVACDRDETHADLWVNGSTDKLVVNLAEELYKVYFNQKTGPSKAVLISLVMKPAILSALQSEILRTRLRDDEDAKVEVKGHRWLRKFDGLLERVMNEQGLSWNIDEVKIDGDRDSDTLAYAVDAMMKRPLAKAMEEIAKKR